MNKNCVCLICHKPNDIWFNFLSTFTKYDIYILIDDNSIFYKQKYLKFKNINVIQINNEHCKQRGFINMNFVIKKLITSWEKAIYYFSTINIQYNHVWFFEDDVFFYNENTLLTIDSNYNHSDLLSNTYNENKYGNKTEWIWNNINIKIPPPYYSAMVCCVRMSSKLLSKIKQYANTYKTLFFLEALFPTICKKYNFQYDTPNELTTIVYRTNYENKDINKTCLFHPVKNINTHLHYRNILKN
jgi:hypothetical protein